MEIVMIIVLLMVVVAYFLITRKKPDKPPPEPLANKKPYAAVSVKPHPHACNAAFDMSHRVFLVADAPMLPLNDCDKAETCRCGYVHYDDRRHVDDRRSETVVMHNAHSKNERRHDEKFGRRKDDIT